MVRNLEDKMQKLQSYQDEPTLEILSPLNVAQELLQLLQRLGHGECYCDRTHCRPCTICDAVQSIRTAGGEVPFDEDYT